MMEVELVGNSDEEGLAAVRRRSARLFRSSSPMSSPQKLLHSENDKETWRVAGPAKMSAGYTLDKKTSGSSGSSTPSSQVLREKSQTPRIPPLILRRRATASGSPTSAPQAERVEQLKQGAEVARKVSGKRKREDSQPEKPMRPRREVSVRLQAAESSSSGSKAPTPTPGLTSDGKIDYHYFVRKFFNRGQQRL
ncbi:hypothetical protein FS749_006126 [Ceratobasidium sp. UAMH 11750]|nr:hypothetical protein FS749_006126 [Ceratobasidium sp. UAMH 11750]